MANDAAALKQALPIMAMNEGVWDGMYRRYGPDGALMAAFKSRVVMRYRDDAPADQMYHQTNLYEFPDGKRQVIESYGQFDGEKLTFGSDRDISGWAADDKTDPNGRTCLLYMDVNSPTPQLEKGTHCYELVQMSECGQYRLRAAQYMKDGKLVMRTLIDEQRVTTDWASKEDWGSEPFGGQP